MKIKDRYIAKTLLTYSLVVMLVWLSIYSFFNFLAELDSVGLASYSILDAFKYIVFQSPKVAYNQASPVILLGCVLGMGHLATTGQLTIFRASGISVLRITWIAIKNALIFIICLIVIGETIAPILTSHAEKTRSSALGQNPISSFQDGFWIRDGNNFINVQSNIDGSLFNGVTVIEIGNSNKIERVVSSESALFDGDSLNMDATNIFSINSKNKIENISYKESKLFKKNVTFNQDLIDSLEKEPKDLKTLTIIKHIQFLSNNKLKTDLFEVELYNRLVKPLTLTAMILLAMLFIFGSTRDTTLGRKIFFGVAIGLSFELISRIGGAIALSLELSPLFSSLAPSVLVIFIAVILLIRKSTY